MEKLQAALQKAREKREISARAVISGKPKGKRPSGTAKINGLWADLKEVELSGRALAQHRVVAQTASQEATPFDIMRTKILLQMRQNNWKRLAITSPMPKSGKTTTACNLALGIGRQGGLHTILFDLDMSDPNVAAFMGHKPEHSIADMLTGRISFAEQAVRIGENVAISEAQHPISDPTRILLSNDMDDTLDQIQKDYDPDIMIFDTPSILTGDNTRAFLNSVDCALIIARADNTRYGHFDACEREIAEHTNVLGVVLNAFASRKAQYDSA